MRKELAIIHYQPLEDYPPVQNLLKGLASKLPEVNICVFTSQSNRWKWHFRKKGVDIQRFLMPNPKQPLPLRMLYYWLFNLRTLLALLQQRPPLILYYESTSAWPAWAYCRFFNNQVRVFVHYHEYFSISQYHRQMWLDRFNHKLECKYLLQRASWISQTNSDRLQFFAQDHGFVENDSRLHVFPNYPPNEWQRRKGEWEKRRDTIRLVYVGAVSMSDTYLEEVVHWVEKQEGKVRFSIYSHNMHSEAKQFLENINSKNIILNQKGVPYHQLPEVLSQYHVGLILYKGTTLNYQYNAPNKLFEYLACNLDVWYPLEMKGVKPYKCSNTFPKVIELNFKQLNAIKLEEILSKKNLKYQRVVYTAENAQANMLSQIQKIVDIN